MKKILPVFATFPTKKLFLSFLSVACVVLISTGAQAQAVEGCSPAVLDAAQTKAQARVLYDVAVTEQIVVKPDSVLAMTCFNQAAGVSAERGGNLFSGSFIGNTNFASVITDALTAFFDQFADAEGNDSTTVVYDQTTPDNNVDCTGIEDLWEQIKTKGIAEGVPYLTFAELISGDIPAGAGDRFTKNWEAGADPGLNIFSLLQTAITQLPVPAIPDFSTANSFCEVVNVAGGSATCP